MYSKDRHNRYSDKEKVHFFELLQLEANSIRETDKVLIRGLFRNFYGKQLNVGIGFQKAYGAVLSGDFFDLIKLPDGNYLFIFADISGHGLPAYTTLVRLRSAITISYTEMERIYRLDGLIDRDYLVHNIITRFTDIMAGADSDDFACIVFTFIENEGDRYNLTFYNRSMIFPIITRKYNTDLIDIYNLNRKEKGWEPRKGHLVGRDLRILLGNEYYEMPTCQFTIFEGDSILFYSDGIIEASALKDNSLEFGHENIERILLDSHHLPPQLIVNNLFDEVYEYIEEPANQKDDMTAVLIDFPRVRK